MGYLCASSYCLLKSIFHCFPVRVFSAAHLIADAVIICRRFLGEHDTSLPERQLYSTRKCSVASHFLVPPPIFIHAYIIVLSL